MRAIRLLLNLLLIDQTLGYLTRNQSRLNLYVFVSWSPEEPCWHMIYFLRLFQKTKMADLEIPFCIAIETSLVETWIQIQFCPTVYNTIDIIHGLVDNNLHRNHVFLPVRLMICYQGACKPTKYH